MSADIQKTVQGVVDFSNGMYLTKCEADKNRSPAKRKYPLFPLTDGCLKGKFTDPSTDKIITRKAYFQAIWNERIEGSVI